ncbi:MAG: hypothetical protein D6685_08705 [Bacteroidetes bacterium]|nr:MAG: hypothetical protein D6685_08705 [Bacteroidota bacterium]
MKRTTRHLLALAALVLAVGLAGCTDGLSSLDEAGETAAPLTARQGKLRHPHLLEQARRPVRTTGFDKDGNALRTENTTEQLSLVVGFNVTVDKQRLLTRFKLLSRYKLISRYEYDEVFNGVAITIEDLKGLNNFYAFLQMLEHDPDVLWYEPDFFVKTPFLSAGTTTTSQLIPWSVAAVGGQTSWAVSGDGTGRVTGVDVVLLDTGVARADSNDPYDDLYLGLNLDFRDSTLVGDPVDHDGHGTHIAGIIGAADDNDGIVGIAPGVTIHNLKVLGDDGCADASVVIAAIEAVMAYKQAHPHKPIVVNLSLGADVGTEVYTALDEAVSRAAQAGVIFVAAAGNQGIDASTVTPARGDVIAVGSYNAAGLFSRFSNYGPVVDLLAPGEDIVSLSPSGAGRTVTMSGTSMAAAHVTGAVALYLARHPQANQAEVLQALQSRARTFVVGAPTGTTRRSLWVGE